LLSDAEQWLQPWKYSELIAVVALKTPRTGTQPTVNKTLLLILLIKPVVKGVGKKSFSERPPWVVLVPIGFNYWGPWEVARHAVVGVSGLIFPTPSFLYKQRSMPAPASTCQHAPFLKEEIHHLRIVHR
jgi:hypothetical protein